MRLNGDTRGLGGGSEKVSLSKRNYLGHGGVVHVCKQCGGQRGSWRRASGDGMQRGGLGQQPGVSVSALALCHTHLVQPGWVTWVTSFTLSGPWLPPLKGCDEDI